MIEETPTTKNELPADGEAGLSGTNEISNSQELPKVSETVDQTIDVTSKDLGYDIEPEKTGDPVIDDISKRLSEGTSTAKTEDTPNVAEPQQAVPFDLSKLSVEQIQQLQQMLQMTPESVKKKVIKPVTQIRVMDEMYIIDAKKSYMKLRKNTIEGRDELAHYIPVKFYGTDTFVEKDYREVMQAERVRCEIVSTRYEDASYIEGEPVIHRETGRLTEREVKITVPFYLIKLPNGDTTEIKGEMSNF